MYRYLLLAFCAILLIGCEQNQQHAKPENASKATQQKPLISFEKDPVKLLQEPIEAVLVETPTEAIPEWRKYKEHKPALVILSNHPFLQQIPPAIQKEALQLILNGSQDEIDQKTVFHSANPTLLPQMAISAALQAGLFSKVIWVLPLPAETPMVFPAAIQIRLVTVKDISKEEASTLKVSDKLISGRLRNTPWEICKIDALPEVSEPVVLHIDLSYFSAIYQNEIITPLYTMLADVGTKIRDTGWEGLSATVSQSNFSGDISLKTRFLGQDISRLLIEPDLLNKEMPELWRQRSQALYLDNLFQKERIMNIYLNLEKNFPEDAAIKYGLFDISGQLKESKRALQYLDEAIAIDNIYALEYLALAERAAKKGSDPAAAYSLLEKASDVFGNDPFITLKKIGMHKEMGTLEHAIEMIKELQKLPWSPIFDPEMPQFLKELEKQAMAAEKQKEPAIK